MTTRQMVRTVFTIACLCGMVFSALAQDAHPNRKALLLGNVLYRRPLGSLRTPIRDASTLEEVLKKIGFVTMKVSDARLDRIDSSVKQFAKLIMPGDIVLYYFAGYGVQVDGENYLIPVGFSPTPKMDVNSQAYSVRRILKILRDRRPSAMYLLLDAAWENEELRKLFPTPGLAPITVEGTNTLVSMSAEPGLENIAGPNSQLSHFANALTKVLPQNGLKLPDIVFKIQRAVEDATGGAQIPFTTPLPRPLRVVQLNPTPPQ